MVYILKSYHEIIDYLLNICGPSYPRKTLEDRVSGILFFVSLYHVLHDALHMYSSFVVI